MHAIILAGGFGTRLQSVVSDVPKPLAPVAGKPFLTWLIESLAAQDVTGVTLSVHHQWEKIRDYFDKHPPAIPVTYAVEKEPLGTGGAMAYALKNLKSSEPVIVLNGDTFVEVDIRALLAQHKASKAALTLVLRHVPDTGRYGEVVTGHGVITAFAPGRAGHAGLINAGVYVLSPGLFAEAGLPEAFSFERDFLPTRLPVLAPRTFLADDYFIDIGIPEDYKRAQVEIPERSGVVKKPALFLDRDGVINADTNYACKPEQISFIDGIFDFCRSARAQGYRLIVITNQAGIGRGYYTEEDFQSLMDWMQQRFIAEGCPLTAWYFYPHHPEHGQGVYKIACNCRKPAPGMILQAARDWNIDLAQSLLIGDADSDVAAAKAAGVGRTELFKGKFPELGGVFGDGEDNIGKLA